jgi:hypothetical protein
VLHTFWRSCRELNPIRKLLSSQLAAFRIRRALCLTPGIEPVSVPWSCWHHSTIWLFHSVVRERSRTPLLLLSLGSSPGVEPRTDLQVMAGKRNLSSAPDGADIPACQPHSMTHSPWLLTTTSVLIASLVPTPQELASVAHPRKPRGSAINTLAVDSIRRQQ